MLTIIKEQNEKIMSVKLAGRLDAETCEDFNTQVVQNLDGIDVLRLDAHDLDYISSAGLRELLKCAKAVDDFAIVNASDIIKEALALTEFDKIITCS